MDWSWSLETLFRALGATPPPQLPPVLITSVGVNPARCRPGALFVPLQPNQGTTQEAHAIETAIRNGAVAALTNLSRVPFQSPAPILRATPTAKALVTLALYARAQYGGRMVAVTGSVGKTTTKELTHHVLSGAGPAHKSAGNFNTLDSVLLVLINRPLDSRYMVVEVAAALPGHLRKTAFVRPHVGMVTNVGVSHLENFGRREDLLREKLSLFDYLEGERVGIVHRSVLDADEAGENLIRAKRLSRLLTVGNGAENDVHPVDLDFDGIGTTGTMSILGRQYRFRLPLPALHFVENAMFAMATACALDLDGGALIEMLATAAPTSRRFQRYRIATGGGPIELIDDAYNAAPASVAAMLNTLGQRRAVGRKVLVLGDMLGLGADSTRFHEELAPSIAAAGVDLLVMVGNLAKCAAPDSIDAVHFADADAAAAAVPQLLMPQDIVAVKGSNDVGLHKVVATIRAAGSNAPAASWRIEDEG